jgi:glycosyltransferase involved in cell wall biosynthesis
MLAADGVLDWAVALVIDDGSTDGTGEAVGLEYPAAAVLQGDGTWWWAGAIRRGMEWALAHGARRVFWLNDDCRPPPEGLWALRERVRLEGCIAWIDARAPNGWSYGGHRKTAWRVRRCTTAEEQAGLIDAFSGNCVCLPREWIERIGLPHDQLFPHNLADLDYGLRLKAAGAILVSLPGLLAENADPQPGTVEAWLTTERPQREIWKGFSSPRSIFHFSSWRHFALRHWGPGWGWVVYTAPYLRYGLIAAVRTAVPALARLMAARRAIN